MTKTEKAVQIILWCMVVFLGGYLVARGLMKLREEPTKTEMEMMEKAYKMVGKEIYYWTFPGYHGENGIVSCFQGENAGEPVVEDEETCDEIIQRYGDTISERILTENKEASGEEAEKPGEQAEDLQQSKVQQEGEGKPEESQAEETQTEETQAEETQTEENQTEETKLEEEKQSGKQKENVGKELPAWAQVLEEVPVKDLSMEKLNDPDYLVRNFFVVDPNTTADPEMMRGSDFLEKDLTLESGSEQPQILIYHTHSQEAFIDSVPGDESMTVVGVGDYLESILTEVFGYHVIHIRDTFDLVDGVLDRSKAYNYALPVVEQVLAENPSIEVVIDLHRDGVPEDKHLVTQINGKPTAQIMLFNGLCRTVDNGNMDSMPNPYVKDNLSFSFQLSYQAAKYYPWFTRCIYLKGYRYNLHVRQRSLLLEVGAQTNTVQEAMNAMEPFSVILNKVLKGE